MKTPAMSLRSLESELVYQNMKQAGRLKPLDEEEPLKKWKHWVLIENRFPYDMTMLVSHLLLPKRKFASRNEVTIVERLELEKILDELDIEGTYDAVIDNFTRRRSVLSHYHVHLVKYYPDRSMVRV